VTRVNSYEGEATEGDAEKDAHMAVTSQEWSVFEIENEHATDSPSARIKLAYISDIRFRPKSSSGPITFAPKLVLNTGNQVYES
jgi:hypothetical protein